MNVLIPLHRTSGRLFSAPRAHAISLEFRVLAETLESPPKNMKKPKLAPMTRLSIIANSVCEMNR